MNAYDDLSAFPFKGGKGYDKRSVEEFRAHALTALDDVLRLNVQLQDRLAGPASPTAPPTAVALHPEEQHVLNRYRALTPTERSEFLRGLDREDAATQAVTPMSANATLVGSTPWSEPAGWADPPAPIHPPGSSSTGGGISWELPLVESGGGFVPSSTAFSQPDWLTEWESVAPQTNQATETSFSSFPSPVAAAPAALAPFSAPVDDSLGWSQIDMAAPAWDVARVTEPFAPPATLPPFMPPPQPSSEVGVPVIADAVAVSVPHTYFSESPLSQEHLDDLFNQLDFGPPSVDLLPHGESSGSPAAHVAPLHVGLAPESDQPLPPPVRPWEGWIR